MMTTTAQTRDAHTLVLAKSVVTFLNKLAEAAAQPEPRDMGDLSGLLEDLALLTPILANVREPDAACVAEELSFAPFNVMLALLDQSCGIDFQEPMLAILSFLVKHGEETIVHRICSKDILVSAVAHVSSNVALTAVELILSSNRLTSNMDEVLANSAFKTLFRQDDGYSDARPEAFAKRFSQSSITRVSSLLNSAATDVKAKLLANMTARFALLSCALANIELGVGDSVADVKVFHAFKEFFKPPLRISSKYPGFNDLDIACYCATFAEHALSNPDLGANLFELVPNIDVEIVTHLANADSLERFGQYTTPLFTIFAQQNLQCETALITLLDNALYSVSAIAAIVQLAKHSTNIESALQRHYVNQKSHGRNSISERLLYLVPVVRGERIDNPKTKLDALFLRRMQNPGTVVFVLRLLGIRVEVNRDNGIAAGVGILWSAIVAAADGLGECCDNVFEVGCRVLEAICSIATTCGVRDIQDAVAAGIKDFLSKLLFDMSCRRPDCIMFRRGCVQFLNVSRLVSAGFTFLDMNSHNDDNDGNVDVLRKRARELYFL